jgi:hypothetical protein
MYLGLESDGEMLVSVIDDNEEVFEYTPRRDRTAMAGARVQIGKGLASRYWQFQISNVDGADFELDTVEIMAHKSDRRDI